MLIAKALYEHAALRRAAAEMAVLTFTNKAADEIRERMRAADPDAETRRRPGSARSTKRGPALLQALPVGELGLRRRSPSSLPMKSWRLAERLIVSTGCASSTGTS